MTNTDVRITQDLRDALYESADVTFSIATDAPDDRLTPAVREIWRALWDVGLSAPSPTGEEETPSYVSDPISITPGTWKVTVDFAHVPREERTKSPEMIASILRQHTATPAVLDTTHLTKTEYDLHKEALERHPEDADPTSEQPRLFRL
jgi:hypothetical protein